MSSPPAGFRAFAGATAGVSALVLVLTQPLGGREPSETATLEPIPAPTFTAAPGPSQDLEPEPPELEPIGAVVYQHDFSAPENGVLAGQPAESATNEFGTRAAQYTDGGTLLVSVESPLDTYVAGASSEGLPAGGLSDLGDVSIEADVTPVEIGAGAAWGLACRRERGAGSFYYGLLSQTGGGAGAAIIRQDVPGGEWIEIGSGPIPAGVILGEGETHHLRLDCIGSTIILYANGQEAARGEDATYAAGSVALFANPPAGGGAVVEFDNLVIREV